MSQSFWKRDIEREDSRERIDKEAEQGGVYTFVSSLLSKFGGVLAQIQSSDYSMASTRQAIDLQQPRDEAIAKKNMNNEGRNRRALSEIGNQIPANTRAIDAKPPSRPVTRSFRAQLLANAQAQSQAENNKKSLPVNVEGAINIDKPVLPKPLRKVTTKPKPEDVIEISPDTVEEVKKEIKHVTNNNSNKNEVSARKKGKSLTSVLNARSKLACEIPPKEQMVDIDAADVDNELAVVEYVEDMYKFYKIAEHENRVHDYIHSQEEINERMRSILIDWLVDVHNKFELNPETLYLTINILDRYLASKPVPRRELQLVGVSAMLMASKYEEIWAPEVNDFVCISDRAYTHQQVLIMEKRILGQLEWNLTVPTPYVFLVRFIKASVPDQEMENLVHFLAELGVMNYATIIYCPSMLAASAVYAARCTLKKSPLWNETLKVHTGFSEPQLLECAKLLVSFHSGATENKLRAIHKKYSNPEKKCVALLPPAKNLGA